VFNIFILQSALPDIDIIDTAHTDPPVPAPPKNDAPNKFWASVEPYCAEISTADIQVRYFKIVFHGLYIYMGIII
jgi:hypothetical protein